MPRPAAAEEPGHAFALILAAIPLLVLIRVIGFAAPHQDPKTLALIALGIGIAALSLPRLRLPRRISVEGWLLSAFAGWAALGVLWSPNPCRGGVQLALWLSAALVARTAAVEARRGAGWWPVLAWALAGTGGAFGVAFWWGYSRAVPGAEYSPWVFFSSLGHVNFTGDFAAPWLALLAAAAVDRRLPRALRALGLPVTVSLLLTILLGASRAAAAGLVLAAIAGVAGSRPGSRVRLALACAGLLLVGVLLHAALPMPFRPLSRLIGTPAVAGAAEAGAPATWLGPRGPMYLAAWRMVRAAPLLGHGSGSFVDVYPGYAAAGPVDGDLLSAGRTFVTNPHSALLEVAAELGLPAAVVLAALLLRMLLAAWRGAREGGRPERVGLLAALAAMVPGLLFSHTAHNAASLFLLSLCGGLACAGVGSGGEARVRLPTRAGLAYRLALTVLALVAGALGPGRHLAARWQLGQALAAADDGRASARFARARRLDPYSFRAGIGVAAAALERGDAGRARAELERVATFHPSPRVLGWLAALPPSGGEGRSGAGGGPKAPPALPRPTR